MAAGIFQAYWSLLDRLLEFVADVAGVGMPGVVGLLVKVGVSLAILYAIYLTLWRVGRGIRRKMRGTALVDAAPIDTVLAKDPAVRQAMLEKQGLADRVPAQIKEKDFAGAADSYAKLNHHELAAKYYIKARKPREAAEMLAKAGHPSKAAKLLLKHREPAMAAGLYAEAGKHLKAARAYESANDPMHAAASYAAAKRWGDAARVYTAYFSATNDPPEVKAKVADQCLSSVIKGPGGAKLKPELRAPLLAPLAGAFAAADRFDTAAPLYEEALAFEIAGDMYAKAGKLQEASRCYRSAGKSSEAESSLGRFHEEKQEWPQAAKAYMAAGNLVKAGEAFAKAEDFVSAANCFRDAKEHYRAGLAYCRAARYAEAIQSLQHVAENHPQFDASRGLLGRAFYELGDYEHAAAALENHLLGKRVDNATINFYYLLSLAYEQLGRLQDAQQVLLKIRTVNVGFRDVSQRLSNVSSRISMSPAGVSAGGGIAVAPQRVAGAITPAAAVSGAVIAGRYKLETELGKGGMGVVFRARDTQLDRPVAVKFLSTAITGDEEFLKRFLREARAAARISHANIVAIYEVNAEPGTAFLAMEFVDGISLHEYIQRKGGLPPKESVNIVGQACNALQAIHEAGIVHRDIKPQNLLLTRSRMVKLSDFGLAKTGDMRLTRTGMLMGTPSYMAPEQVLGKEADQRADLYAMGLILHECITGKTLFLEGEVLERQLTEIPQPPGATVANVPPQLDALVEKALRKKPEERFQTAAEMLTALRALSL